MKNSSTRGPPSVINLLKSAAFWQLICVEEQLRIQTSDRRIRIPALREFRSGKPGSYPDQSVYAEYACAEFGLVFRDIDGGSGLVFSVSSSANAWMKPASCRYAANRARTSHRSCRKRSCTNDTGICPCSTDRTRRRLSMKSTELFRSRHAEPLETQPTLVTGAARSNRQLAMPVHIPSARR